MFNFLTHYQFHSPWALLLLLILPVLWYRWKSPRAQAALRFSVLEHILAIPPSLRVRLRPLLYVLRTLALILLILALARPQKGQAQHRVITNGVLLELVVDRSGSMQEQMNYRGQIVTRLDVVKMILHDFVLGNKREFQGRPNDLLGLITFAGFASTACPLVHAHDALVSYLDQTTFPTTREEDGTAIGEALALAVARLETAVKDINQRNQRLLGKENPDADLAPEFKIQSKAIILLTDGINNKEEYLPLDAADYAKKSGIKIYTIGIGTNVRQNDPFGFPMMLGNQIDEPLMKEISARTGGFYARADSPDALAAIIEKIDALEKTKIESVEYSQYEEKFLPLTLAALILLVLEFLCAHTWLRKVP